MADLNPGDGNARALKRYWTRGPGLAKWATSPTPFRTLVALLRKYVRDPEGLAATYFRTVFGIWPGHRKGTNPVGPG